MTFSDLAGEDVRRGDIFGRDLERSKRINLVGGPLDGVAIASHLYFRTGRGKRTAHISLPLLFIPAFDVKTDEGVRGQYVYNDEARAYWWVAGLSANVSALTPDADPEGATVPVA